MSSPWLWQCYTPSLLIQLPGVLGSFALTFTPLVFQRRFGCRSLRLLPATCNLPRVSMPLPRLNASRPCNCVTVAMKYLQWDQSGEVRAAVISGLCWVRSGSVAQFGCCLLPTTVPRPRPLSLLPLPV
ncbi:hypothetical protein NDU88_009629 [Pleurodeles waltl]|uniref:Uncharacterized protein n=1 Tax=Pleurodeles waltl TaxID=8319 RepID=A0AAV7QU57_PLEWA|nr:hypothetical protein NDU88_009629 [Pleurodeles waltl]